MSEREDKEFNIDTYLVSSFQLFYPKTSNLIIEIVNDFISEFNTEFYANLNKSRNNSLVIESIYNQCFLIINDKISRNDLYRTNLNKYEKISAKLGPEIKDLTKDSLKYKKIMAKFDADIKDLTKDHLKYDVEIFFHFAKITSILLVKESIQKELMKKLKIYKIYKPAGNKYKEERRYIYRTIPLVQIRLVEEYGADKKGKSDLKSSVKKTIKILEKENRISLNKHNPNKVYDSYRKDVKSSKRKSD